MQGTALSQLSFRAGQFAQNPRIVLAGEISGFSESLEERLNDVVRFIPVKQLQMQVAPCFIGERLEKFPQSSTVWCASTCKSPLQRKVRSITACFANSVSI